MQVVGEEAARIVALARWCAAFMVREFWEHSRDVPYECAPYLAGVLPATPGELEELLAQDPAAVALAPAEKSSELVALLGMPAVSADAAFNAFRALANVRPVWPLDQQFLRHQDALLQAVLATTPLTRVEDLLPAALDERLALWQGDICRINAQVVVNAANSGLTGCWRPLHLCIDNAIQTFAGAQLRAACAAHIEAQGTPEPTGTCFLTPAYNLPARCVAHTVGPIAHTPPTSEDARLLAQSYAACLDAAAAAGATSIAFCCISTGVFGYAPALAAPLAVTTVRAWLDNHAGPGMRVVFNVFLDSDKELYERILFEQH